MGQYDDAAKARKAGPPPADTTPPRNPHACAAHGCPVWGSVTIDGTRLCFVHGLVANRRHVWDHVTARLRNRSGLIEVVRLLRGGGSADATDSDVMRHALRALPDLADDPTVTSRYRALAAVERTLIAECIEREDPVFADPDRLATARSQVAALADRFTRPAMERA